MKLLTIFISILLGGFTYAGHHEKSTSAQNTTTATLFIETVLTNPSVAQDLLHEDFNFKFMGISQLSEIIYDKETYFSEWMVTVGELIPGGFRKLDVVDAIGDESGVALMVDGDADGINGLYANNYVFVFKFSEGAIISLREYASDLLVETRLYKQTLVAED